MCEEGKLLGCAKAIEQSCELASKTTILKPERKSLTVKSSDQDIDMAESSAVCDSIQEIEAAKEPAPCLNCDAITSRLCSGCGDVYYCSETCEMFARHVRCG